MHDPGKYTDVVFPCHITWFLQQALYSIRFEYLADVLQGSVEDHPQQKELIVGTQSHQEQWTCFEILNEYTKWSPSPTKIASYPILHLKFYASAKFFLAHTYDAQIKHWSTNCNDPAFHINKKESENGEQSEDPQETRQDWLW